MIIDDLDLCLLYRKSTITVQCSLFCFVFLSTCLSVSSHPPRALVHRLDVRHGRLIGRALRSNSRYNWDWVISKKGIYVHVTGRPPLNLKSQNFTLSCMRMSSRAPKPSITHMLRKYGWNRLFYASYCRFMLSATHPHFIIFPSSKKPRFCFEENSYLFNIAYTLKQSHGLKQECAFSHIEEVASSSQKIPTGLWLARCVLCDLCAFTVGLSKICHSDMIEWTSRSDIRNTDT